MEERSTFGSMQRAVSGTISKECGRHNQLLDPFVQSTSEGLVMQAD